MTIAAHAPVVAGRRSALDDARRIAATVGAGAWRGRRSSAARALVRPLADQSSDIAIRAEMLRVLAVADPGVADDCARCAGVAGEQWGQIAILAGAAAGGLHAAVHAATPEASLSTMNRLGRAAAAVGAAEATLSAATRAQDAIRTLRDDAELLAYEATAAMLSAAVTGQAAQTAVAATLRDASDARLDHDGNTRVAFWITAVDRQRVGDTEAERLARTLVPAAF